MAKSQPIKDRTGLEALLSSEAAFNAYRFSGISWPETGDGFNFESCRFEDVDFIDSRLTEVSWSDCHFTNCRFDSAILRDCSFDNCEFYNAEDEQGCSFKFSSFPGTRFTSNDLTMAVFERANLYETCFTRCQLTGVDFRHVSNEKSVSERVWLNDCTIEDCNLSYADLTGARLIDAEMNENRLHHVRLDGVDLTGASLRDCEFHGVEADDLTITNADLRGSQLAGLDIRRLDMQGVRINAFQQQGLLEHIGMIVED